jgi:hypothetical protein
MLCCEHGIVNGKPLLERPRTSNEREQAFGELQEVPLADAGLLRVPVTAADVAGVRREGSSPRTRAPPSRIGRRAHVWSANC